MRAVLPDESSGPRSVHGPRDRLVCRAAADDPYSADDRVLSRAAVDRAVDPGVEVLEEEEIAVRATREAFEAREARGVELNADPTCNRSGVAAGEMPARGIGARAYERIVVGAAVDRDAGTEAHREGCKDERVVTGAKTDRERGGRGVERVVVERAVR